MLLSVSDFWRRHRRKFLATIGVVGSGFILYKLYVKYKQEAADLERGIQRESQIDEILKAQLQTHFENIQSISDSMTLPDAMHYLRYRISEELDLSQLTEKLMQQKGHPNTLSPTEKLDLWEKLKILSFTRTLVSLWSMTMLTLYIRVQVNILGRHLYIDTAKSLGSSSQLAESNPYNKHQQEFLATSDYLSNCGMRMLIASMQRAATEVLKAKQLRDPHTAPQLHETMLRILDLFMSMGDPHHWVSYLLPENSDALGKQEMSLSTDVECDQLVREARAVLLGDDFRRMAEISLRKVLDHLEEILMKSIGNRSTELPLAKLLPHMAQLGPQLLQDPDSNNFINIIRTVPEVELFYTLLYANMPHVS